MDRPSATAVGTAASTGPGRVPGFDGAPSSGSPGRAGSPAAESSPAAPSLTDPTLAGTARAWAALSGDAALLDRVSCTPRALMPARLPVLELARASVAVCSLAAAELLSVRDGEGTGPDGGAGGVPGPVPHVRVDDGAVAAAFTAERELRLDGREMVAFAPLSRFWRTRNGWVRTHANYPHHRARLLAALGVAARSDGGDDRDDDTLAEAVAAELAGRDALEVEETVYAAGGLAVAVRTPEEWAAHPQGAEAARRPLLSAARLDQAQPRALPEPAGHGPLHGVRVLDLTRVLAGPVATQVLAFFGADVLRLDPPRLPEDTGTFAAGGAGKRSAFLDLSSRAGQSDFEELLSTADVVVTGYRPGALDRFGLAPESLADRHPGVVVGQLGAWGAYGPWHRRRGFDSLVQAASGIAHTEGDASGGEAPGALPAQALDHGTGYLLAAAVMRALTEQRRVRPGARLVRVALTQTAHWLMYGLGAGSSHSPAPCALAEGARPEDSRRQSARPRDAGPAVPPADRIAESDGPLGRLRHVLPPVGYEGSPADWPHPPGLPGADPASWW